MSSSRQPGRLKMTRYEYAVQQLRREIVNGTLPPGTLLAELPMARRLGVSRVPVREALCTLEREGLVEFSSTGRAYVKSLTAADFEELYNLRLALEPLAARWAAPRLKRDASALEANVAATRAAQSLQEVTRLDLDFHQLILEACGSQRLVKLWLSLRGELELWLGRLHRAKEGQTQRTREETAAAHLEIIACFRERPAVDCERLSRRHIQGWREWLPLPEAEGAAPRAETGHLPKSFPSLVNPDQNPTPLTLS